MSEFLRKKRKASGAMSYTLLFMIILLMVVITMYLFGVAKLMTHQHHADDSLTDAVLASLVADDVYYFETYERTGTPVIRLKDADDSFEIYKDCMNDAIGQTSGFYYNFAFDTFITYEVEGNVVKVSQYVGNFGVKRVNYYRLGFVYTPTGEQVSKTSAYARIKFDIKSVIGQDYITKSKDIYCTLKINN